MYRKASDQDCLDFIRSYIAEHGYAPSMREITVGVGLVSLSATAAHLRNLEKKGVIRRTRGASRALAVVA